MNDNYGQFIRLDKNMKLSDDLWSKEHTCQPYLCTNKDCSYIDEGEHYHQGLCMHKDCAEQGFKCFAQALIDTEDEIYDAMKKDNK